MRGDHAPCSELQGLIFYTRLARPLYITQCGADVEPSFIRCGLFHFTIQLGLSSGPARCITLRYSRLE